MFKFFKEKFFFRVDKEEKEFIRHRVMNHDHITYKILLILIMVMQVIMLIFSFVNVKEGVITNAYRILYIFLFASCFFTFLFLEYFYKLKKPLPYYIFVSSMMFAFMLWGAGISIVDSISHKALDMLYFTISVIATTLFITLEPWASTSSILATSIGYVIANIVAQQNGCYDHGISIGFVIAVPTIVGLGVVGTTFNFLRRISSIRLEMEVSKLNSVLENEAYIDDLTHVYNRRFLTENIDAPLVYGERPSGVMMVDIDHFKKINDNYGHQVGDNCLSKLGTEINGILNGQEAYCVRYGGEEFLIFYKTTTEQELLQIAEELRKRIENVIIPIPGGNNVSYSISVGIGLASNHMSYNHLINNADKALYKAKETRNTVAIYKE